MRLLKEVVLDMRGLWVCFVIGHLLIKIRKKKYIYKTVLLKTVCVFLPHMYIHSYSRVFLSIRSRNLARYLRIFTAHVFIGRCKTRCNYDFRTVP